MYVYVCMYVCISRDTPSSEALAHTERMLTTVTKKQQNKKITTLTTLFVPVSESVEIICLRSTH
jgi:hypothetical protein